MLGLVTRVQVAQWRIRERLRSELGQTTSEYMVIAGVVVVILLTVFGLFRDRITTAMGQLMGNVNEATSSGAR